jgi:hypothetical protein
MGGLAVLVRSLKCGLRLTAPNMYRRPFYVEKCASSECTGATGYAIEWLACITIKC